MLVHCVFNGIKSEELVVKSYADLGKLGMTCCLWPSTPSSCKEASKRLECDYYLGQETFDRACHELKATLGTSVTTVR